MEDDLEEKVLQQACLSQMKFLSKFSFSIVTFFNRSSVILNVMRFLLRPEVLFFAIFLFVICFYLQALELNALGLVNRISRSFNFANRPKISFQVSTNKVEGDSWEEIKSQSAVFAIQGRRPKMEDR
jgi:protein phosphatase 1L